MRIDVEFRWHPGTAANPRPSMKVTARAHRREGRGDFTEYIHTRLVDQAYPEDWSHAMAAAVAWFAHNKFQRAQMELHEADLLGMSF